MTTAAGEKRRRASDRRGGTAAEHLALSSVPNGQPSGGAQGSAPRPTESNGCYGQQTTNVVQRAAISEGNGVTTVQATSSDGTRRTSVPGMVVSNRSATSGESSEPMVLTNAARPAYVHSPDPLRRKADGPSWRN